MRGRGRGGRSSAGDDRSRCQSSRTSPTFCWATNGTLTHNCGSISRTLTLPCRVATANLESTAGVSSAQAGTRHKARASPQRNLFISKADRNCGGVSTRCRRALRVQLRLELIRSRSTGVSRRHPIVVELALQHAPNLRGGRLDAEWLVIRLARRAGRPWRATATGSAR